MAVAKELQAQWRVIQPEEWPVPPVDLSVSTYTQIDECPLRWALGAAEYPELGAVRGYPQRVHLPALAGIVVHLALEIVTREFARVGVPSQEHELATQVLKDLGGYTKIVQDCVERTLHRLEENPRALQVLEHAQRTLRGQVPSLRARVQAMVARLGLRQTVSLAAARPTTRQHEPPQRLPLTRGVYTEVGLRGKKLGWKGTADLLVLSDTSCEITDFKTGAADTKHEFQVRVYAVLWRFDDELNPSARAADRLVLAYEGQDIEVQPPNAEQLDGLRDDLLQRRRAVEAALAARPPAARPSEEACRYCGVRQLCEAYWTSRAKSVSANEAASDVELKIVGQHGSTSWNAVVVRAPRLPARSQVLLRLQRPVDFEPGTVVRVLDAAIARDPEDDVAPIVVTLGIFSELYRVN